MSFDVSVGRSSAGLGRSSLHLRPGIEEISGILLFGELMLYVKRDIRVGTRICKERCNTCGGIDRIIQGELKEGKVYMNGLGSIDGQAGNAEGMGSGGVDSDVSGAVEAG